MFVTDNMEIIYLQYGSVSVYVHLRYLPGERFIMIIISNTKLEILKLVQLHDQNKQSQVYCFEKKNKKHNIMIYLSESYDTDLIQKLGDVKCESDQ